LSSRLCRSEVAWWVRDSTSFWHNQRGARQNRSENIQAYLLPGLFIDPGCQIVRSLIEDLLGPGSPLFKVCLRFHPPSDTSLQVRQVIIGRNTSRELAVSHQHTLLSSDGILTLFPRSEMVCLMSLP
jgi:hypothetical protein